MQKVRYTVVRPVVIDHISKNRDETVMLYPKVAQFWLADGTLVITVPKKTTGA